jgi:hypothetical protein
MARNLQGPIIKALQTSAAQTSTTQTTKFTIPLADTYTFYVNATAVTGTSPTLDICWQTSTDGGTTWVNVPWRHTQITAAGVTFLTVRLGIGVGEVGAEGAVALTGGTLVKPATVDPNNCRLSYTIGGTSPSFTFTYTLFAMPPGSLPFA